MKILTKSGGVKMRRTVFLRLNVILGVALLMLLLTIPTSAQGPDESEPVLPTLPTGVAPEPFMPEGVSPDQEVFIS